MTGRPVGLYISLMRPTLVPEVKAASGLAYRISPCCSSESHRVDARPKSHLKGSRTDMSPRSSTYCDSIVPQSRKGMILAPGVTSSFTRHIQLVYLGDRVRRDRALATGPNCCTPTLSHLGTRGSLSFLFENKSRQRALTVFWLYVAKHLLVGSYRSFAGMADLTNRLCTCGRLSIQYNHLALSFYRYSSISHLLRDLRASVASQ